MEQIHQKLRLTRMTSRLTNFLFLAFFSIFSISPSNGQQVAQTYDELLGEEKIAAWDDLTDAFDHFLAQNFPNEKNYEYRIKAFISGRVEGKVKMQDYIDRDWIFDTVQVNNVLEHLETSGMRAEIYLRGDECYDNEYVTRTDSAIYERMKCYRAWSLWKLYDSDEPVDSISIYVGDGGCRGNTYIEIIEEEEEEIVEGDTMVRQYDRAPKTEFFGPDSMLYTFYMTKSEYLEVMKMDLCQRRQWGIEHIEWCHFVDDYNSLGPTKLYYNFFGGYLYAMMHLSKNYIAAAVGKSTYMADTKYPLRFLSWNLYENLDEVDFNNQEVRRVLAVEIFLEMIRKDPGYLHEMN